MKESFRHRLKFLRTETNLTQELLAEHLSIPRANIANWELGRTEPDINGLIMLADFFNVSVDYLICHSNTRR